ncbi:hypothetical protein CAPTEDRAFT_139010 [Capitella teleta]|uniref:Elongation of very long chain fatty acids protein n=1 Tax=Capitella teleta TaxID=283909 RepID=R7UEN1_CAPTE|nr:hypothetical protein CAPTEDRAFT_139010 [Capitella teleta]|eukprot:ELU02248.1 hypothetical protein CAPTEDRAFT_139010 [Capitella teleta]
MSGIAQFCATSVQLPSFPIFCAYLLMIALSGWWQKLSHPLNLSRVMLLFNFLCCALSLYTFVGFTFAITSYHGIYDLSPSALLKPIFFMYWVSKLVELCDTLFMILRHRRRQISFLHVYHHGSMLLLSDYTYRHTPWPTIGVFLGLNSLVHIILYGYYGLSVLRPGSPPSWKRRLTEIQIAQFIVDLCLVIPGYLHHGYCVYSIFYAVAMTIFFTNFYYRAYVKNHKSPEDKKCS